MANLSGCVQYEVPAEDPILRPMGLRKSFSGDTVLDFKGNVIPLTRPYPRTVFFQNSFDLHGEINGIRKNVSDKHREDVKMIRRTARRQPPRNGSLADPNTFDPDATVASVIAKKKRLKEINAILGEKKCGSLIKPLLIPDDVTKKGDVADFRLEYLNRDIGRKEQSLVDGSYKESHKHGHVPIGIMIDENQNEVILYDQYPQSYRMSEAQSNFFARSQNSLNEIGTGKNPANVHPKIKEYDWREAYLKQEMAMGRRKG